MPEITIDPYSRYASGVPNGVQGEGLRSYDSGLAWEDEGGDRLAGRAAVEAAGSAEAAVDEDLDDRVVDKEVQASLGGERLGHFYRNIVDADSTGGLRLIGANLD